MSEPSVRRKPLVYLTKRVEFSAAHRLYREELSEEENRTVFGKCANPYGHGHNYVLEATFTGTPNPRTGMLVHFDILSKLLDELVTLPLDHRHLNHDVQFLEKVLPTSENLVMKLWERITVAIPHDSITLFKLRLESSPRNRVEYFGSEGGTNHG